MMSQKIEQLTPEQEALIPVYREKWRRIALSTKPIDRQKAADTIKAAYAAVCFEEPYILFCDSPFAGLINVILRQRLNQFRRLNELGEVGFALENRLLRQPKDQINCQLHHELQYQLIHQPRLQLVRQLEDPIKRKLWLQLEGQLDIQLDEQVWNPKLNCIEPESNVGYANLLDFCFSVLNCTYEQKKGEALQSLVKECGWIFPYEKICIVCDRPRVLSFDDEQHLHAEGAPAIQFADGFSVYAYHGVELPEKYGVLHPNHWQAKWLLEEDNAELRRVLIQGIGYSRICQEWQAAELDFWQEYTLLKIDDDVDIEPIYLLKMTCPSTGFIHALRVPPDVKSAREAICWVNWGIDPEEFSVQT